MDWDPGGDGEHWAEEQTGVRLEPDSIAIKSE